MILLKLNRWKLDESMMMMIISKTKTHFKWIFEDPLMIKISLLLSNNNFIIIISPDDDLFT